MDETLATPVVNTTGTTSQTTTPDQQSTQQTANKTNDDVLGLLKTRLKLAQAFCKKPHEIIKKYMEEYELSDFDITKESRDQVRIGYVFRHSESDLPAMFDDQPDLFMKGKGKYRTFDTYLSNTYEYLWDSQGLEEIIEDAALYFDVTGMGFVGSPWVTETKKVSEPVIDPNTGQPAIDPLTGQPQIQEYDAPTKDRPSAEVKDIFKLFFSPETKFGFTLTAKMCPYYFEEQAMSTDEVLSRFNKQIDSSEVLHTTDADVNNAIGDAKNTDQKADLKRVTVYEYYGVLPKEMGQLYDQTSAWTYDKEYHVYLTTNEVLQAEECQYTSKPLLCVGNYGFANKFWKNPDTKYLLPLVREYQQYRAQILKHARRMANPKALIAEDMNIDENAFSDSNIGKMVKYQPGNSGLEPKYLQAPNLGTEVGIGIQQVKADLEQTGGSFQLAQGSDVSTVKTPEGIKTFSEASDKNIRRKRKKIARFIRALIIFQFMQCARNWDINNPDLPDIIFAGEEQPKVQLQDVIQVLGNENILAKVDIEVESLSLNRVTMRQDALDLFNTAVEHPDIFNVIEFAKDLLQNGYGKKDADRYLISMDQIKAQAVQEFIQQIGQVDPAIAGQLSQIIQQPNAVAMQNKVRETINFKDLPPQGKLQMAEQAGLHLGPNDQTQKPVPQVPAQG